MAIMNNTKIIEQVDKICDAIRGSGGGGSVVSDIWDATATYQPGEYVIYQNLLYKCLATTTPGVVPSEGIYWTITRVSDEIEKITSDIDSLNGATSKLLNVFPCWLVMVWGCGVEKNNFTIPSSDVVGRGLLFHPMVHTGNFKIEITVISGIVQYGRAYVNGTLPDIISTGVNRVSFNTVGVGQHIIEINCDDWLNFFIGAHNQECNATFRIIW